MCSKLSEEGTLEDAKKAYYENIDKMLGGTDCDSLEDTLEWPCSGTAIVSACPIIIAILMVFFLMK